MKSGNGSLSRVGVAVAMGIRGGALMFRVRLLRGLSGGALLFLMIGAATVPTPSAAIQPAAVAPSDTLTLAIALATFDTIWTRIHTTHYDSLMNGVDWRAARERLRPRAAVARTTADLRNVLRELLAQLGESHYTLIPREVSRAFGSDAAVPAAGSMGDVGLEFRMLLSDSVGPRVNETVVVTSSDPGGPAWNAGIRAGWQLLKIDGIDVDEALTALDSAPSIRTRREGALRLVLRLQAAARGPSGDSVALTVVDLDGIPRTHTLVRRSSPGNIVKYGSLPPLVARTSWQAQQVMGGRCIGVIRFNTWMPVLAQGIDAAVDSLRSCAGMVIDLRGNTGGIVSMSTGISGHFLLHRDTIGVLRTRSTKSALVANPRYSNAAGERVEPFQGPLAILVDELTGSTSELFAAALQRHGRARVFGGTSAGQALPATLLNLPNGDVLMYVVADLRGPGGIRIEGAGVTPDVSVPRLRGDLIAGVDRPLIMALEWIAGSSPQSGSR